MIGIHMENRESALEIKVVHIVLAEKQTWTN
jgi:hypothetical protein